VSSAADFIRNFQPTKQLLPSSGKLKREVSMEEIFQVKSILHSLTNKFNNKLGISRFHTQSFYDNYNLLQLTSELEKSYDRRGTRVEPFRSALEMHRERFTQRLEQSTADRTRIQEEAWARLDRVPSPEPSALNSGNRLKR
jgi:hypothetical protein